MNEQLTCLKYVCETVKSHPSYDKIKHDITHQLITVVYTPPYKSLGILANQIRDRHNNLTSIYSVSSYVSMGVALLLMCMCMCVCVCVYVCVYMCMYVHICMRGKGKQKRKQRQRGEGEGEGEGKGEHIAKDID